jgi:hypothetical protein
MVARKPPFSLSNELIAGRRQTVAPAVRDVGKNPFPDYSR